MAGGEEHILADAYVDKAASYFEGARADYVSALPKGPTARIIELGCGAGGTGRLALERGKAGYYLGIEAFEPMAARARTVLSRVVVGDIERMELPSDVGLFDALILSEVLEHLASPEQALAKLARTLKPGAMVFASSPNISHWRNIINLIQGRFDYEKSGMMDYTHLKWFTPASFRRLFEDAGFDVTTVEPLNPVRRSVSLLTRFVPSLASMTYFQINLHGRYGRIG